MNKEIKLTKYSHGAGCGCKISPKNLKEILTSNQHQFTDPNLIVGNLTRDDAAVYNLGNGKAIISTTDFFMPIVDDPRDFGAIASVNAISDIYAMGGQPLVAISILGWPIEKIPAEVAAKVVEGSRKMCTQAGISLAGGHSIDSPEPIFGLAVTGIVDIGKMKRNDTASINSILYLTKPLGTGILSTAQKKGHILPEHFELARDCMLQLNDFGQRAGKLPYVNAMTDVTGFGLLGHLIEICESSKLSAMLHYENIPKFDVLEQYLSKKCIPGGTIRNLESYGNEISETDEKWSFILADPQTSGGLLISVDKDSKQVFENEMKSAGLDLSPIGELVEQREKLVYVT